MDNSYNLLYVDDEPDNLSTFKARFRKLFNVFTASSGKEGLELLEKHDIQLIISDQRMPEMSGVQLLEEVKDKHPDIVRIILTAYTESEDIINAINRGGIYQYVKKPWVGEDLKTMIDKGLAHYSSRQRNKDLVNRLYGSVNELEQFYYHVSQQLQGHVSSQQGILSLALSENNLDQLRNYLQLLGNSASKLESSLRTISDIKSGIDHTSEIGSIDFGAMLQNILFHLEPERAASHVEVKTNIQPDINFHSWKNIMYTLLQNLVERSLHSFDVLKPRKYLSIEVRKDEHNVIIELEDNGTGSSVDNKQTSYVIDKAIDVMKGKISVDDQRGIGTKTTIEFPFRSQ